MFYALTCFAGLIAGFVGCWVLVRHLLSPINDMLEAAGYKLDDE
jgi:hypothetical protein